MPPSRPRGRVKRVAGSQWSRKRCGNLAERSAKAAKSTAELIDSASRHVREGVAITGETRAAFGEIARCVSGVKDQVGGITETGREQTLALEQISAAMAPSERRSTSREHPEPTVGRHGRRVGESRRTAPGTTSPDSDCQKTRRALMATRSSGTIQGIDQWAPLDFKPEMWQALQQWVQLRTVENLS